MAMYPRRTFCMYLHLGWEEFVRESIQSRIMS